MVLNDASPQSEDYSNPPFQNGPRSHLPIPGYPLVFKTEYLARPDLFTLYFGFFGQRNWLKKNEAHVHARIEASKVLINRLPTQQELDAWVEYNSRYLYHGRMGAPYGGAVGAAYVYWRVRRSKIVAHLAPGGVKPGTSPTPAQVFAALKLYATIEPGTFRWAVLSGAVRWFLFWPLGGALMTSIWGMFHFLKDSRGDPRLQQFYAEAREKDPEEVRRRKIQRVVEQSRAAKEAAQRRAQGLPPVEEGAGAGEGVYAESHEREQGAGAYGSLDSYSSSAARGSVPSASPYGGSSAESMRGATTVNENKGTDFFGGDDASPVAADYQSGGSQGSAWDRIRQQAGSRGEQDSGLGSAWNRGSAMPDNERQQRDQAQADFDRLLEAERNMAGASEGGEKKGWGRWN